MFSRIRTGKSTSAFSGEPALLRRKLEEADAVLIGAGAGLSAAAGFEYEGERFQRYFSDFAARYHFADMYSGGFYPYDTLEEHWAYWSRYIWINRYMDAPRPVYDRLYQLVKDKDYFVLTTNVDHCFQKAGFAKERLFYTQGDYGLFQCSGPCHPDTYDNREAVQAMLEAQGCRIGADGALQMPESAALKRAIPGGLVPRCPRCGRPMSMNLRADGTFVEDAGWHVAARRYQDFVRRVQGGRVLYWELGVGMNTPGIIKYNFWRQTYQSPRAWYACVNLQAAYCPPEIQARAVCLQGDIGAILNAL